MRDHFALDSDINRLWMRAKVPTCSLLALDISRLIIMGLLAMDSLDDF